MLAWKKWNIINIYQYENMDDLTELPGIRLGSVSSLLLLDEMDIQLCLSSSIPLTFKQLVTGLPEQKLPTDMKSSSSASVTVSTGRDQLQLCWRELLIFSDPLVPSSQSD